MTYYLTNRANPNGYNFFQADLLPASDLLRDSVDRELLNDGWLYCETQFTQARYLVRPRRNKRYLKAWGCFVTDFEIRRVETCVNSQGVLYAGLGEKIPGMPKVYSKHEVLGQFDRLVTIERCYKDHKLPNHLT